MFFPRFQPKGRNLFLIQNKDLMRQISNDSCKILNFVKFLRFFDREFGISNFTKIYLDITYKDSSPWITAEGESLFRILYFEKWNSKALLLKTETTNQTKPGTSSAWPISHKVAKILNLRPMTRVLSTRGRGTKLLPSTQAEYRQLLPNCKNKILQFSSSTLLRA